MVFSASWIKPIITLLAITVFSIGCVKEKDEISQDITSQALNFYVINQEIDGIRVKVSLASTNRAIDFVPGYYELASRCQKMLKDNAISKNLNDLPDFKVAMDSCLSAAEEFLTLEAKTIEAFTHLADVNRQLKPIKQSIRYNSLLTKKYKTERNILSSQKSKYTQQLDILKPKLNRSSLLCRRLLIKYNKVIIDEKILSFVNDDGLFDPFKWEKPAPVKKPSTKRVKK